MAGEAPQSIHDVLEALDSIIDTSIAREDPTGYFAALYRLVTERIETGLGSGIFDDDQRMERLDVLFARRYLDAHDGWQKSAPVSRCWGACFAALRPPNRYLVLQHLLLGINAHINLDLGIATAETAQGTSIHSLKPDFDRINDILGEMLGSVQERINAISPMMRLVDLVGGRGDETMFRFALRMARTGAWELAESLASMPASAWTERIAKRDRATEAVAHLVLRPGPLLRMASRFAARFESRSIADNIRVLRGPPAVRRAMRQAPAHGPPVKPPTGDGQLRD